MKTGKLNKLVWLGLLSCVMLLAGCAGNSNNSGGQDQPPSKQNTENAATPNPAAATNETEKTVELIWYYSFGEIPADLKLVQDAVNKITLEKINATVKLMPVPSGDYAQKMNTVIASGEQVDLVWTSGWQFSYPGNVSKGAFTPLDELIEKYGQDITSQMPSYMMDGVRINGKIYAIPNYQSEFMRGGYVVQKEYLDKYAFDSSSLKSVQDIEPLLAQIKAGDPGLVPFAHDVRGSFDRMYQLNGLEEVLKNIAVIRVDDPGKVLSRYELPIYEQYLDTMRDWYEKGYINQDAATLKSFYSLVATGKVFGYYHNGLKPGGEQSAALENGGHPVELITLTNPKVTTTNIIATTTAIAQSSKNKERAMMLLNLVNSDSELFNLLAFGIEGTHYNKNPDGTVTINMDGGYKSNMGWVFGNSFNGYELSGGLGTNAALKKLNEESEMSPILGFSFDSEPVTTQIANVNNVVTQYQPSLETGAVEKTQMLNEFREKLKQAGIDEIIDEIQKQMDDWRSLQS